MPFSQLQSNPKPFKSNRENLKKQLKPSIEVNRIVQSRGRLSAFDCRLPRHPPPVDTLIFTDFLFDQNETSCVIASHSRNTHLQENVQGGGMGRRRLRKKKLAGLTTNILLEM
jgi:hypothetical protein